MGGLTDADTNVLLGDFQAALEWSVDMLEARNEKQLAQLTRELVAAFDARRGERSDVIAFRAPKVG